MQMSLFFAVFIIVIKEMTVVCTGNKINDQILADGLTRYSAIPGRAMLQGDNLFLVAKVCSL